MHLDVNVDAGGGGPEPVVRAEPRAERVRVLAVRVEAVPVFVVERPVEGHVVGAGHEDLVRVRVRREPLHKVQHAARVARRREVAAVYQNVSVASMWETGE